MSEQDIEEGQVCIPINASEQIEFCYARGWTDGLPVVPATRWLVRQMLEHAHLAPEVIIADMPSRKVKLTAEKVAINAVMAGCKAEYLPVVVAAVKALATPEFGLHHAASALAGPTIAVVVNGPIAREIGINSGANLMGPGERANATIGRAVRMILLNCLRYRPGVADRSTFGTPGKYTCCFAENEEDHPWQPWHVARGFQAEQSTVTLVAASTMIQIWNYGSAEQLMCAFGDALSFLGSIAILGQTAGAIVLGGEHAELLRKSGLSRADMQKFIVANTGRSIAALKRSGRIEGEVTAEDEATVHYAMDEPHELAILCGGSNIGALSMVMPGFGSSKTAGRSPAILIESTA